MPRSLPVTQTIILAAGYGSRLGSAESGVPKPLMTVGGLPLIAHALEHARASGCAQAVIVVGHEGDRVQAAVEQMAPGLDLRFVENPDFTTPNGLSLLAAERMAAGRFYLQMVDHVFAGVALPKLAAIPFVNGEDGRVLVDNAPGDDIDLADATKVQLAGTRVLSIGKGIGLWDAIDTGCFVLTPAIFDALRRVPAGEGLTVSSGMRQLAASGSLGAVDVDGVEWIDVDTPADLETAERLLLTAAAPMTRTA
jgi:choline kinase